MKDTHTSLLTTIKNAVNTWQTTAQGANCTILQINVQLPDGTSAVYYWRPDLELWDIYTEKLAPA